MNLGKNIQRYRERAGLSQKELADLIGISNQRLSNWEKGTNMPNADYIAKLCEVLEIKADELLGLKEFKSLSINQAKLLKIYDKLTKASQDIVMRTAEDLLELEENQTTILIPIISEGRIPTTELDYYDQAAGLGPGQIVENPLKTKIKVASNQVPEEADYVIRVYGDSMEPIFSSGDKLYIKSTNVLKVGDVGVFSYQGEELVKELGVGKLISYNPEYQPIKVNANELFIQGKVLGKV